MRRSGFTLIEVLLAMVISVVAFTIIAQAMAAAHRGVVVSERRSVAALLAGRRIAEMEGGDLSLTESVQAAACPEDERYSWSMDAQGSGELREVTLRVTWTETGQELVRVMRLIRKRE